MISIDSKRELFGEFDKKSDFSNRSYLANTYGTRKNYSNVVYYDKNDISTHEVKKKKTKYALIALSAVSVLAALGVVAKSKKVDFKKMGDTAKHVKELDLDTKANNLVVNINSLKDDLWDRFTSKLKKLHLPVIRKLSNDYTEFNLGVVKATTMQEFEKAYKGVVEAGGIGMSGLEKPENWFDRLYEGISDKFGENHTRISKEILNKENRADLTKEIFANDRLEDVYDKATKLIDISKIPQDNKKLIEAATHYNDIKILEAKKLLPKLRDLAIGSAPTDFINQILIPAGLLGVAVTNADTKEEKQSTVLDLGIPILTAFGFAQVANARALSGLKALLFGLITGQAVSKTIRIAQKQKEKVDNALQG